MDLRTADFGAAAMGGLALGFLVILLLVIILPIVILIIVGKWKMYKKAGKSGWEAIVPFYSDWVYVEISGLEWWWFFALIFNNLFVYNTVNGSGTYVNFGSLVALFGSFICNYNISKKLHKDTGFAVLMTLFPFVMLPLIGFSSKYDWDNSVKVSKNGPFDDNKSNDTLEEKEKTKDVKKSVKYCSHCGKEVEKTSKFCSHCGKEI